VGHQSSGVLDERYRSTIKALGARRTRSSAAPSPRQRHWLAVSSRNVETLSSLNEQSREELLRRRDRRFRIPR